MSLFQISVINKYLENLDLNVVENAYNKFKNTFTPKKIEIIRSIKEEEYQDGFLRDLFCNIFNYILKPDDKFNLIRESKNISDNKKADGAIIKDGKVFAVIELKSTKTKDMKNITNQAFNYKNNHPGCKYVVTSNFMKLRFYIDYSNEFEEFNIFNLSFEKFQLFYLLLNSDNLLSNIPEKLKEESIYHEEEVSKSLYSDYSSFKNKLYQNLIKNNSSHDKLTLFKKSQKLLDRFLFILFAEDRLLLPPNSINRIIKRFKILEDEDAYKPLYDIYKQYFGYMNIGRRGKTTGDDIPAYNGGLFYPDETLDKLIIDDEILIKDLENLSSYDFNTDIDVNILGHIFEHSLAEIEEITAEIEGKKSDKSESKRKKDGVFYTPKYITQYIVENTIGKLCIDKKIELKINDLELDDSFTTKQGTMTKKGQKLYQQFETYKSWLLSLKIVDPACGSGAFLNQALDFLISEHNFIMDSQANIKGGLRDLFNIESAVLENNLFGVDINEESVEIAKLSLWLRTAKKGRKLSVLSNNIKCGNSLIDDPEVAGHKAFNWYEKFPQVFQYKNKNAYHITWVTHNSRTSQRMIDYHVQKGEAYNLTEEEEIVVTKSISEIVKDLKLNVLAYNICRDHVHILLVCEESELNEIVRKMKGKSAIDLKKYNKVPTKEKFTLWAQKFNRSYIEHDDKFENTLVYVENNRTKHNLPMNNGLKPIVQEMRCTIDHAFRDEYDGGFDVVIGNPPYVDLKGLNKNITKYIFNFFKSANNRINLYSTFIEKSIYLLRESGNFSFIIPSSLLTQESYRNLRLLLLNNTTITNIVRLPNESFGGSAGEVKVDTIIFSYKKGIFNNLETSILIYKGFKRIAEINTNNSNIHFHTDPFTWKDSDNYIFRINVDKKINATLNKIKVNSKKLVECAEFCLGLTPYDKYKGHNKDQIQNRVFHAKYQKDNTYRKLLAGNDIKRYFVSWGKNEWISYGDWLGAPRENKFFTKKRILIKQIIDWTDKRIWSAFTEEELYNTQNAFNLIANKDYDTKYLLIIINSKLMSYYHRKVFLEEYKDRFQKILIKDAKEFPIKHITPDEQTPFIQKADQMLLLHQQLQEKKAKFLHRVSDNLNINKFSKKLESFYNFDFKTFVTEINKSLKKTHKNNGLQPIAIKQTAINDDMNKGIKITDRDNGFKPIVQKSEPIVQDQKKSISFPTKLSLKQQDDWEDYFKDYKLEINEIQRKITQTDQEFDKMVYQLYELSDEEIKIIEE